MMQASDRLQVPLSQPWITDEDIAAVISALHSPWLSMGPHLRGLEQAMAYYLGTATAVAVSSGTAGLHLCMAAANIRPGDEVITSPFSFIASSNCILYMGATPVFADIDPSTLNIDADQVEARLTPRTRGLLSVDVFGQPAAVERLAPLVERYGLIWIQDSCEALGARRNDRFTAPEYGKASVFAFFPNKQMTMGEGGIVATNDMDYARLLRSLCNQGRDDNGTWMNHVRLGFNYRLDEMSAALGRSQLSRIELILDLRARVANWYAERLHKLELVHTPYIDGATTRMSWFVYVIRLDDRVIRSDLMRFLEEDGIPTRPYFVPIHLQPLYRERFGYQPGSFPVTERIAHTTLALPFFSTMSEDQVDYVCDRLARRLEQSLAHRDSKVAGQ